MRRYLIFSAKNQDCIEFCFNAREFKLSLNFTGFPKNENTLFFNNQKNFVNAVKAFLEDERFKFLIPDPDKKCLDFGGILLELLEDKEKEKVGDEILYKVEVKVKKPIALKLYKKGSFCSDLQNDFFLWTIATAKRDFDIKSISEKPPKIKKNFLKKR